MPIQPVPMASTAGEIINRVAAETGIEPVLDPFASPDPVFRRLQYLLNTAGEELAIMFPWECIQSEHTITTLGTDTGDYPLPIDFAYMIQQTGWERSQNVPLGGPLSPQDWQYLLGRDLVSSTIYASFRLREGQFSIFPQPPPGGLDIHFEYVSRYWVQDGDNLTLFKEGATKTNDIPLYNRLAISRYLKVKYLESNMMDSTKAQDDFNQIFQSLTAQSMSAPVLDAGQGGWGVPYLDAFRNTPDTGFGA